MKSMTLYKLFFLLTMLFIKCDFVIAMKRLRSDSVVDQVQQLPSKEQKVCIKAESLYPFSPSYELKDNIKNNTEERPYHCDKCPKSFTNKYNLKQHSEIHLGKSYYCSICSKKFSAKRSCNQHMKTHTSEKPHICTVCSKSFALSYVLTRHMKSHTEEKKYVCPVCSKELSCERNLSRHVKIHSQKERPSEDNTKTVDKCHIFSNEEIDAPLFEPFHQNSIIKEFCLDENFSEWYN